MTEGRADMQVRFEIILERLSNRPDDAQLRFGHSDRSDRIGRG